MGRKLLKTVQTITTFRNPLADPVGTRRGPPLVRGPQFENRCSNALCTLVKRETKSFQLLANCQGNVTDLAGSLLTSSRPATEKARRGDDRTSNAGVAVQTADGSRRRCCRYSF